MQVGLVNFVLVEDTEDHAILIKKTLESEGVVNSIRIFGDAEAALVYLQNPGGPNPNVILLDINLPGMSGLDLLKILKQDPELKKIPVVILSTSEAETDRARAYEYSANSYVTKPIKFDKFRQMTKDLGLYWGVWNQPHAKKD